MLIPWIYFLKDDEQLLIESPTRRWTVEGPRTVITQPFQRARLRKGLTLGPTEYLLVRDNLTGELFNVIGPRLYFPAASHEALERRNAIPLKPNQYIRLIDTRSGSIRVEKGESSVLLNPTEKVLEDVRDGINIDEHTAVQVLDTETGQRSLVTEHQVFIPAPNQELIGVSKRIRLEDHEVVVIKDRQGRYSVRRGSDEERSFFLEPYSDLVQFTWSTGLHKDHRNLQITRIDTRPKFMWYEFDARTQDNVELVLGITFFWQIVDVEKMIQTTDDTPGDVCSHARSAIIQFVSQVSLEKFLASFNSVVRDAVLGGDGAFYTERGVRLHSVEVRSVACKDDKTQNTLNEIIREATDRLNRLQKQESENEVRIRRLSGEIEAEQMKGRLLEARAENEHTEALISGQSEAVHIKAFLDGLGEDVTLAEKLAVFNVLRKREMLADLSKGNAQIYFTPADVDLSIEAHSSGR